MNALKAVALITAGILLLLGASYGGLMWNGVLATKQEQIRHDVTKQSIAYKDGMRLQLGRMKHDWDNATSTGKIGIEAEVRNVFAQVDTAGYPPYLKDFLRTCGIY